MKNCFITRYILLINYLIISRSDFFGIKMKKFIGFLKIFCAMKILKIIIH